MIDRVAHKVQPSHAQPGFVDGIVVQRIALCHVGHAQNGVVAVQLSGLTKAEGVIARCDHELFPVGKLIVQIAAKVKIFGLVGGSGTHNKTSHSGQAKLPLKNNHCANERCCLLQPELLIQRQIVLLHLREGAHLVGKRCAHGRGRPGRRAAA